MPNLKNMCEKIKSTPISISEVSSGSTIITPSLRNQMRAELEQCMLETLRELDLGDASFYLTSDGIALAIPNDSLKNNHNTVGEVCFTIKISAKPLDYDASFEEECFEDEKAEKQAKKAKVLAKKQAAFEQAQRARANRAEKDRERRRKLAEGKNDQTGEE